MERRLILIAAIVGSLALLPLALIARARAMRSPSPRVHLVQDMDNQGRFKSQQANLLFADRRAMRPPVEGTVAVGELNADDHLNLGTVGDAYATTFPAPLTMERLERGRQRYEIYCTPCHGLAGYGDGAVSKRADRLQQGTWVPPASLHAEPATTRVPGHVFNTITHGIRNMPAYGSQISVDDRWAIVGYITALQRSRQATLADVPAAQRDDLAP